MADRIVRESRVALSGGVPTLFVNGKPFPAAAYMTYLAERNDYAPFAAAGYRLFSVPVLFAGRWINSAVENRPFHRGVFDEKGAPDFSALDDSVRRVLAACPDACIFPRLNCSMPLWWIGENPGCTDGTGQRELLFCREYRETAAGMLRGVIAHINGSDYASHIVGYQLAGGNTEEWFHFDLNGGYCRNAERRFDEYLEKQSPGCGFSGLPDLSPLRQEGPYHRDDHLARYVAFANRAVAETVCFLCAAAKEATGGRLVVGTFYGYSLEVSAPLWGTHALRTVLECGDVDFICSPNSYVGTRDPGADWTEMYPADSARLHGKLCMQECDVRTHLTRPLSECAPEYDREKRYAAPIWQALPDRRRSADMLRKTFCRQLIKGNGFWWFDMWGGWYRDPVLMDALRRMREVYVDSLSKQERGGAAELAVFADESAYRQMTDCGLRNAACDQRTALGRMGAPYDMYDVFDFEATYRRYKAALFVSACPTERMRRALALCRESRLPFLAVSEEKQQYSSAELRAFCRESGVHVWCDTDDIVYVSKSFLAVCAVTEGVKRIDLGGERSYRELLTENGARGRAARLELSLREHETRLFEILPTEEKA